MTMVAKEVATQWLDEIDRLSPWHHLSVRRRGGTGVGLIDLSPAHIGTCLCRFFAAEGSQDKVQPGQLLQQGRHLFAHRRVDVHGPPDHRGRLVGGHDVGPRLNDLVAVHADAAPCRDDDPCITGIAVADAPWIGVEPTLVTSGNEGPA